MTIDRDADMVDRVAVFAALADPARLAIVDHLLLADASPSELCAMLGIQSNLLAHHLGVLKKAGVVAPSPSEADRRRTYLRLNHSVLDSLVSSTSRQARRVVFVCTQNSARSQLAAAIWNGCSQLPATSAGTHPAARVHPGAVSAARRHQIKLRAQTPRLLDDVSASDDLIIAVCDNAHEELPAELSRLHWSVADPTRTEKPEAFDAAVTDLTHRIGHLVPHLTSA